MERNIHFFFCADRHHRTVLLPGSSAAKLPQNILFFLLTYLMGYGILLLGKGKWYYVSNVCIGKQ